MSRLFLIPIHLYLAAAGQALMVRGDDPARIVREAS